jgi:hypothetical protein
VHAGLVDWQSRQQDRKNFSSEHYRAVYQHHMLSLQNIQDKNPKGYHSIAAQLYKLAQLVFWHLELNISNSIYYNRNCPELQSDDTGADDVPLVGTAFASQSSSPRSQHSQLF